MKVGFIGTGNMGRHMARNVLQAGFPLTVYDIRREATAEVVGLGAAWADTPQAVAQASEITFTSLPGPKEVEEVTLSEKGILAGAAPGSIYIDLSTNSPTTMRRIAAIFQEKGVHVLDAPVSGGVYGAATRRLAVMVGGEEAIYQRAKPVLDAIGDKVMYAGDIGAGCVCKIVNNMIAIGISIVFGEAFTLGVKAGATPRKLYEAVSGSSGNTWKMQNKFTKFLFKGNFEPGFALKLALKDIGLGTALAKEMCLPLECANLVEQMHIEAIRRGWGELDSDAIVRLYEERAGVELRIPDL